MSNISLKQIVNIDGSIYISSKELKKTKEYKIVFDYLNSKYSLNNKSLEILYNSNILYKLYKYIIANDTIHLQDFLNKIIAILINFVIINFSHATSPSLSPSSPSLSPSSPSSPSLSPSSPSLSMYIVHYELDISLKLIYVLYKNIYILFNTILIGRIIIFDKNKDIQILQQLLDTINYLYENNAKYKFNKLFYKYCNIGIFPFVSNYTINNILNKKYIFNLKQIIELSKINIEYEISKNSKINEISKISKISENNENNEISEIKDINKWSITIKFIEDIYLFYNMSKIRLYWIMAVIRSTNWRQ